MLGVLPIGRHLEGKRAIESDNRYMVLSRFLQQSKRRDEAGWKYSSAAWAASCASDLSLLR